jgi:sterol desaturase/sphingolipid hydroxylase (fatty acid hydroxylase superfamily)
LANFGILVGNSLIHSISIGWKYTVFALVEPLQFVRLTDTLGTLVAAFVIGDLAFYGYHRITHRFAILWTMHHTHHSSLWMNLTTAFRLNWMANFISPFFFAPLILVGFSPALVALALALGLFYQYFLHTQAVRRFGRLEGKILNTPSAHRVHHGSNAAYIDKNFGGVFILWDRLFGTYQAEVAPVNYGTTTGFVGHNPLRIQFAPLFRYLRRDLRTEARASYPKFGTTLPGNG